MYEEEESIKKVQRLVIEAIAAGLKELTDEHSRKLISKETETKLIRLIEDLSDAFEKSI